MEDLISRKKRLVDEIYTNTKEQSETIKLTDETKLNILLDKRNFLIDNVIKLQDQIKKLNLSEDQLKIMASIDEQIKDIQYLENLNFKALRQLQIDTKKDIAETQKRLKNMALGDKAINSGYLKQYSQANSQFYDKKQ